MKTLREKIRYIKRFGEDIESLSGPIPDELLDEKISHISYSLWSDKLNDYYPTWQCKRIYPIEDNKDFLCERFMSGNYFVEIAKREFADPNKNSLLIFSKRKSADKYWMDQVACEQNVVKWANSLFTELINNNLGRDSDYDGYDPSQHWRFAKRRYGLKDNSTRRLALLTEVDPEGRFRCLGEDMPRYIEYYLSLADLICGLFSGVTKRDLKEEDLWSSEMKSIDEIRFGWAMDMLSKFNF